LNDESAPLDNLISDTETLRRILTVTISISLPSTKMSRSTSWKPCRRCSPLRSNTGTLCHR
jgi:hypothetical protein